MHSDIRTHIIKLHTGLEHVLEHRQHRNPAGHDFAAAPPHADLATASDMLCRSTIPSSSAAKFLPHAPLRRHARNRSMSACIHMSQNRAPHCVRASQCDGTLAALLHLHQAIEGHLRLMDHTCVEMSQTSSSATLHRASNSSNRASTSTRLRAVATCNSTDSVRSSCAIQARPSGTEIYRPEEM